MEIMNVGVKEDIKILVIKEKWTFKEVAKEMTKKTKKNYSGPNLSQKLIHGTLKYEEAKIIAEILGYELEFIKKK